MTQCAFLSLGVACRFTMASLPPDRTVRSGRFAAGMICRLVPRHSDRFCRHQQWRWQLTHNVVGRRCAGGRGSWQVGCRDELQAGAQAQRRVLQGAYETAEVRARQLSRQLHERAAGWCPGTVTSSARAAMNRHVRQKESRQDM
jgi:hypothetical protein